MWDYSSEWMNYKGVICPLYSFFWVLLAIIGIVFADSINYYILLDGERPAYKLFKVLEIKLPERK